MGIGLNETKTEDQPKNAVEEQPWIENLFGNQKCGTMIYSSINQQAWVGFWKATNEMRRSKDVS